MTPKYDIFRRNKQGMEMWIEPALTLDGAKARIQELGATEPGDFFIFNHKSTEKVELRVGQIQVEHLGDDKTC